MVKQQLIASAEAVLSHNNRGNFTVPSTTLYPHQWLWDSCFIAIGLAHLDPRRAARELNSLFRGQWRNGMLPHIIFSDNPRYWYGPRFWQSHTSAAAPVNVDTSGMTQPPMPAIAAGQVAEHLPTQVAKGWLAHLYPKLLAYHQWIYEERDPDGDGLAVLVSPWESGLDNTPPWVHALRFSQHPDTSLDSWWLKARRRLWQDAPQVPAEQRTSDRENLQLRARALSFRRRGYDSRLQILRSRVLVEDLAFNCILVAANRALKNIADTVGATLPGSLAANMHKTTIGLEQLWDKDAGEYYPRHYRSRRLLKASSIATFLPLFAGCIEPERAAALVNRLRDTKRYWSAFPVPSAPLDSPLFNDKRYWQGPTWLNTNWLIAKGLARYGFTAEAEAIRTHSIQMVEKAGFWEYFSPISGEGYGTDKFSWTAALTIDFLKTGNDR